MRHKWTDPYDLEYNHNNNKSVCEKCGLIRMRLTYTQEGSVIYYHPNDVNAIEFTAPKCKQLSNDTR